jgi:uncharacterized protein HemY
MKIEMHPSGLTMDRWDHPFKTQQERQLVVKYFEKLKRKELHEEAQKILDKVTHMEDAPL